MENREVWEILEKIKDLPTLPAVYFKVNRLLQDRQASLENVSRAIEVDPAMSAKILRLVNSAFYGMRSKSSSISHAIMVMGFNTVKNAVVSVTVLDTLGFKETLRDFDIAAFWRHSISVAVLAKQLAGGSRLVPVEDAFMTGLLHDIGKIIMVRYFGDEFAKVLQKMREDRCSFADAETEVAAIDHVQIGAYLVRKCQLPENVIEAVAGHHYHISSSASSGLVDCIVIANALANSGYRINPEDYVFETHVEKALAPLIADTQSWLPEALEEIEAACSFFLEK